jgi:hypothetical protein
MPKTGLEEWAELERQNLAAARIIAADPVKYDGIMLTVARRTIQKAEERSAAQRKHAQPSLPPPSDAGGTAR